MLLSITLESLPSISLKQYLSFPEESGVYFCERDDDVIYVGSAQNVRKRWMGHKLMQELEQLTECIDVRFLFAPTFMLPKLERTYIERLQPSLNKTISTGRPLNLSKSPKSDSPINKAISILEFESQYNGEVPFKKYLADLCCVPLEAVQSWGQYYEFAPPIVIALVQKQHILNALTLRIKERALAWAAMRGELP